MGMGRQKRKKRPSYPSLGRQGFGLLLTVGAIIGAEALAHFKLIRDPGGLYLLVAILVTYISGLRTGLISIGIIVAYLSSLPFLTASAFHDLPFQKRNPLGYAILLPIFCVPLGLIRNRLRNAATREWDANYKAETETQQRIAIEADLKTTEGMWRLVVDSAMDAIVAMEADGTITLWNSQAEEMFGWTADEVVGRTVGDVIVPPDLREAHTQGLARYLATGEAKVIGKRLELSAITKDGREFPTELTIVHDTIANQHVFIGFIRDITEQRKLGERLRQAQKLEAIGTLAGGIAHDFNNILAAISGNLLLAQEDASADPNLQLSLREIEKAAARARYIVRQILTFSRAKETNVEAIDVEGSFRESIDILQAALPTNIQIQAYFEPNLPTILADQTDLHQILLNLGINAQQAMEGRQGRLEIQVTAVTLDVAAAEAMVDITPGKYVRISIGDNGVGMDAATLEHIFEPFFTTKTPSEGTGLGLAVVHGIVKRHKGAINAYSGPGKGTVFHIYFPASESLPTMQEEQEIFQVKGNGERILYVDDDDALVSMMTRMLSRLNYEVSGFQSAEEALATFKRNPSGYDLVITDLSMPHLDGPTLVSEIHAIRPEIPIVMVTGYIRPNDLEQARNIGIKELILKPNTAHEMGETLHRVLTEIRLGTPGN